MTKEFPEALVAQGPELIRGSERHRQKMVEIRLEVIGRYSRENGVASWWWRLFLLAKIEWEIARERRRRDPAHSV
jgi:hypothetical protein